VRFLVGLGYGRPSERDLDQWPLNVQIRSARDSTSGLESVESERLDPAQLSVNRLGSGLMGSRREVPDCFQRSQVQILPPLRMRCPEPAHCHPRATTAFATKFQAPTLRIPSLEAALLPR
jgi:hypothetical protein